MLFHNLRPLGNIIRLLHVNIALVLMTNNMNYCGRNDKWTDSSAKFKNHSQTNGKLIDFIPNGGTTLFQSEIIQTGTTVILSQHHRMNWRTQQWSQRMRKKTQ